MIPKGSIRQDLLIKLRERGKESEVLDARLQLVESDGLRKDLKKLATSVRVYPDMLPIQAAGRWSTKNPNLAGFTREFWHKHHDIVQPDVGEWWLEWDWQGIECRMFTAYSGDQEDIEWLQSQYPDIHSLTCKKYLFEWEDWPSDWAGQTDERRVRAKNFRYGVLQYGQSARSVLSMPGIEKLGIPRTMLVRRAQWFLDARPKGVAWKQATWSECVQNRAVHTFMGRRRLLYGPPAKQKKEGLNTIIQGSVADLMNYCLITISNRFPDCTLVLNKHDGAIIALPQAYPVEATTSAIKQIVEQKWEIGQGIQTSFPAHWTIREAIV